MVNFNLKHPGSSENVNSIKLMLGCLPLLPMWTWTASTFHSLLEVLLFSVRIIASQLSQRCDPNGHKMLIFVSALLLLLLLFFSSMLINQVSTLMEYQVLDNMNSA